MTISVYFRAGEPKFYESFEDIVILENYNSITSIICRHSNLIKLPKLPLMLERLYCEDNYLTALPDLPPRLRELRCCRNQLESLPKLPYFMEELYCSNNNVKQLPELIFNDNEKFGILSGKDKFVEGGSLRKVWCDNNNLVALPKLPFTLETLKCSHNNINQFPELPNNFNCLDISSNNLKKIPHNLIHLWYFRFFDFSDNNVSTSIPWFGENLEVLKCNNNPISYVSYILPKNLTIFECANTNIKTIPNYPKYLRSILCETELGENIKQKFPELKIERD